MGKHIILKLFLGKKKIREKSLSPKMENGTRTTFQSQSTLETKSMIIKPNRGQFWLPIPFLRSAQNFTANESHARGLRENFEDLTSKHE